VSEKLLRRILLQRKNPGNFPFAIVHSALFYGHHRKSKHLPGTFDILQQQLIRNMA